MANLISSNVQENEIAKASDFNNAFDSVIGNVAKMAENILECTHDFVIGGKLSKVAGSWTVNVAPIFGVCNSTGIPFSDTEKNLNISVNPGDTSGGDKYGIIEVRGNYITFNEQQRKFYDPDTDTETYQYVDTQKKLVVQFQYSFGDANVVSAPDKTDGWVKLAEIFVPKGANGIDDCTINNITADVVGDDNIGWTNDKSATYDVGYISDLNARFRKQHNEDGSHKEKVIGAKNIKIGVDTDNVNGSNVPVGSSINIDGKSNAATDSISSLITACAAKITAIFEDYVNKGGKYNFNGELTLSDIFDSQNKTLTNALKIGAAGDGTAYLKIGDTKVLTITSDGKLQTSGYIATANNDIVTKQVTDAINTTITKFKNEFSDFVESIGSNFEYANNILSRYKISDTSIQAISTENVSLSGLNMIDGVALHAGYAVLLKDQTDKSENGIWEVQTGAWNRKTDCDSAEFYRYKYFSSANGNKNKGKLFYCPSELTSYTSGTTNLVFKEADVSIKSLAHKMIMRDSAGRAKVATPVEADDIARKAEVDLERQARTQAVSSLSQAFQQAINAISGKLSSHVGNKSNPHGVSKEQLGLSNVDNTKDADKSVKYAASARHSDTSNLLQAYTTDDYAGGNHFIKAIRESGWNMRLYGCYFNGAKQSDCVKVNYANSAGKAATADSAKNADTVGGYRAGNGVNMLVPVVAFNVGENAGYIKLGNGLIVQWGVASGKEVNNGVSIYNRTTDITLPLSYSSKNSYAIACGFSAGGTVLWDEIKIRNKTASSFSLSDYVHSFITIGR